MTSAEFGPMSQFSRQANKKQSTTNKIQSTTFLGASNGADICGHYLVPTKNDEKPHSISGCENLVRIGETFTSNLWLGFQVLREV